MAASEGAIAACGEDNNGEKKEEFSQHRYNNKAQGGELIWFTGMIRPTGLGWGKKEGGRRPPSL
jgi:hypothetical protein